MKEVGNFQPFQDGAPGEMVSGKPITAESAKLDGGPSSVQVLITGTTVKVSTAIITQPLYYIASGVLGGWTHNDGKLWHPHQGINYASSSFSSNNIDFAFGADHKVLYPSLLISHYDGQSLRCLHSQ